MSHDKSGADEALGYREEEITIAIPYLNVEKRRAPACRYCQRFLRIKDAVKEPWGEDSERYVLFCCEEHRLLEIEKWRKEGLLPEQQKPCINRVWANGDMEQCRKPSVYGRSYCTGCRDALVADMQQKLDIARKVFHGLWKEYLELTER